MNTYNYCAAPQDVDMTKRATLLSICKSVLNTAGVDAYSNGFGVDVLNKDHRTWVLSRFAIELVSQPGQYQDYSVDTWVSDYGRVMTIRNFSLKCAGEGFGNATSQWAMIDEQERTIVDLSKCYEKYGFLKDDIQPPIAAPKRLSSIPAGISVLHKVSYSDIDFNSHMNALRYLEKMFDLLPLEWLTKATNIRLDVHYMKETFLGEEISIKCSEQENVAFFEVLKSDGVAAVRASFKKI